MPIYSSKNNYKHNTMLSIGLMSGTSMDGIDAALLQTDGEHIIEELGHTSLSYDPLFKILLYAAQYSVHKQQGDLTRAKEYFDSQGLIDYLNNELKCDHAAEKLAEFAAYLSVAIPAISLTKVIEHSTFLHGLAVKQLLKHTGYTAEQITVVGYHGQTLYHQPQKKLSIIVGDGLALAQQLKITVVNDFRRQDIAAGGHGAPFAPLYHQALIVRDKKIPASVINCGGIANVSLILGEKQEEVIGFDTGPGNGLIDRLVRQRTAGQQQMDLDGRYGLQGKVHPDYLTLLYEKSIIKAGENYFKLPPPKSLDWGDLHLIEELAHLSLEDACATLEAFTADSIISSIAALNLPHPPNTWILAGGGWNNPVILRELKQRINLHFSEKIDMLTAAEVNWNSSALEAQIFAYFAVRSLQGKALSLPSTTGVVRPMTGGTRYDPSV